MVYLFHKIAANGPLNDENWTTVDKFEEFAETHREEFVSLYEHRMYGSRGLVITFDGVYESVYINAFPILKKLEVPFELFVVWGAIGGDNRHELPDPRQPFARFCNMREIWEMLQTSKAQLQSHSFSHPNLNTVSKAAVAWETQNPFGCQYFAYPYGKFNEQVIKSVSAGFVGGVSVVQGDDSDYQIRRIFLQ